MVPFSRFPCDNFSAGKHVVREDASGHLGSARDVPQRSSHLAASLLAIALQCLLTAQLYSLPNHHLAPSKPGLRGAELEDTTSAQFVSVPLSREWQRRK